jgi:hypothetical protein
MLYGAPHQMRILAADLRADDRGAADRTRAGIAAMEPAVGPPDHRPAADRVAAARAGRPAAAAPGAPAHWWPRLLGRPAR